MTPEAMETAIFELQRQARERPTDFFTKADCAARLEALEVLYDDLVRRTRMMECTMLIIADSLHRASPKIPSPSNTETDTSSNG